VFRVLKIITLTLFIPCILIQFYTDYYVQYRDQIHFGSKINYIYVNKEKQCTYNVTIRHVPAAIAVAEKH